MSIKKLPNSSRYLVRVKFKGRERTKVLSTKKSALTWEKAQKEQFELIETNGITGVDMTFEQCAWEYLDQWTGKDTTHPAQVERWIKLLGKKRLLDITPAMIREEVRRYAAGSALRYDGPKVTGCKLKSTGRPRTASTVRGWKFAGSAVMRYAFREGYVAENPFHKIPVTGQSNKRERYLTDDERKRLLTACKASSWDKLYLLVLMALTTGCRQGELLQLRWSDIDFKQRTAVLHDTKNGSPRIVPIPQCTLSVVESFREVGKGLIFPSQRKKGRPFEFRRHWNKAVEEAGLHDFRFHDLRHSSASLLINAGVELYTVGQILGHKSQQTTARYSHLSVETKQQALERVMSEVF